MRTLLILLFSLSPLTTHAADPWGPSADLKAGKALHDKSCVSCHVSMYGKDGSEIYTRDHRKLSNKRELLQRVASCNAMTNSGWFPEEEGHVAAWLNQQHYRFKQ